ncbi:uncharacterized protein LOC132930981 [Rhopalosiphum padi]|uniref:uncharacterized protein LOC132930981 n=1 Tax=Rhopalosiphum padi TaxID=40932 RepID=UPI00298DB02D|nr:uncharacterized protein LOC132930981 [Rhopalosiphum padi]XP_060853113.1 uncharacterized protein LOC132930981 [Rhopalosiphum padi]XP_060853114.1 uncharacterized protein LOC132930981 [Rhopalosiphum padi]
MKITRKCRHGGDEEDDVCYMSKVNKGAQKIMIAVPDQLAVVFMWSLVTGVFIFFLMTATYLVLKFESPSPLPSPSAALHSSRAERCPTEPKHPLAARQDVGSGDVHYVFLDDDRIPRLSACSLESAVNAISGHGSGRVNVFVVGGIKRIDNYNRTFSEVSLSSTVDDLKTAYGDHRLNVMHVSLEEYLECSPFRGVDMSGRSALAKFAVQLIVLWQFGGTVLDDGVVVVRGDVYRATSSAVEYGDRTISSPIACHAFVYEAMLSVKKYALGGEPFAPDTGRTILDRTATVVDALSVADWVMCRGGVAVDDHCYYEEATAESLGYRCPVAADEPPSPKFQETVRATSPRLRKPVDPATTMNTTAAEDGQNRNTTDDERVSAVI